MPIIAGAVAGGVIAVIIASGSNSTKTVTVTTTRPAQQPAVPASFNNGKGMTINQIYKSASPGVVDIVVTTQGQGQSQGLFGGGGSQQTQGEGAGVVYDTKGDILTDEHVVNGASSVKVNFQNGKTVEGG
jgi:S1-C subfamily serine protease